jgi:hypothetical protein
MVADDKRYIGAALSKCQPAVQSAALSVSALAGEFRLVYRPVAQAASVRLDPWTGVDSFSILPSLRNPSPAKPSSLIDRLGPAPPSHPCRLCTLKPSQLPAGAVSFWSIPSLPDSASLPQKAHLKASARARSDQHEQLDLRSNELPPGRRPRSPTRPRLPRDHNLLIGRFVYGPTREPDNRV